VKWAIAWFVSIAAPVFCVSHAWQDQESVVLLQQTSLQALTSLAGLCVTHSPKFVEALPTVMNMLTNDNDGAL
jgi:lipid-A-disaccharide synthase-like uncharacterized protein